MQAPVPATNEVISTSAPEVIAANKTYYQWFTGWRRRIQKDNKHLRRRASADVNRARRRNNGCN